MDNQRLVTTLHLSTGLAGGLLVRSAARQVVVYANLNDPLLAGVVTATTLGGLVVAVGLFAWLSRHAKVNEFAESAAAELVRITWPTREETVHNTGIVVGTALGFGLLMFVYDNIWSQVVHLALYSGSTK